MSSTSRSYANRLLQVASRVGTRIRRRAALARSAGERTRARRRRGLMAVGLSSATVRLDPDRWHLGPGDQCIIPTYDGSGVVVHPSVRFFDHGWAGYRYWMAITPYPKFNEQLENPSIVVSDDGITWTPPRGLTNPVVDSPPGTDYNSDPHLAPGPDGLMWLIWRETSKRARGDDIIKCRCSRNGVEWGAEKRMVSVRSSEERILSPAVWWDGRQWVMLAVDAATRPRRLTRRTAAAITGPWSEPTVSTVTPPWPTGRDAWHLDAMQIGGQVVALVNDNRSGTPRQGHLYLMVSDDGGRTFRRGTSPSTLRGGYYRSAMVPSVDSSGRLGLEVWAGSLRRVERVRAEYVDPDFDAAHARDLAAACRGAYPFVMGDDFRRDDHSTLGFAPSGQPWTPASGDFALSDHRAHGSTNASNRIVIVATPDVEVSAWVENHGGEAWLVVRSLDSPSYLRGGFRDGRVRLELVRGEEVAGLGHSVPAPAPTGRNLLALRALDDQVSLSLNGRLVTSVTESSGRHARKVGIESSSPTAEFASFVARAL